MISLESENVRNSRGKWGQAGVPHKGWVCIDIEDSGELSTECEMCESQTIRHIHYMQHKGYPEVLAVGCICAGHMEEDLAAAKERDDFMKSRSSKRSRWLTRKWKESKNGNEYLVVDGYHIVIYKKSNTWAATITSQIDPNDKIHSRRPYVSDREVKIASFDLITKMLIKNGKTNND